MSTPTPELVAHDALLLRAFALAVFARRAPAPALVAHARGATDAAWSLFLKAEACAVPLARALRRRAGDAEQLPQRIAELIAQRELIEQQRIMVARWQLGRIDALAATVGLQLCVIKGGALLGDDRRTVDVGDIDLLVRPEDAERACAVMRALGMTQPDRVHILGEKHLPTFMRDGMVPVEIHTRLLYGSGWTEITIQDRPLDGHALLRQWSGPNALLGMLVHSTELHPHRCGHLRDLLVMADAVGDLGAHDEVALAARVAQTAAPEAMSEMLALATALRRGAVAVDSPRMRAVAALKYADLLTPESAWIARSVRARPLARYLPAVVPFHTLVRLLVTQLRVVWRTPHWQPRGIEQDSSAALAIGAVVTVLWRLGWMILTSLEGIGARRRARRAVARADHQWRTAP